MTTRQLVESDFRTFARAFGFTESNEPGRYYCPICQESHGAPRRPPVAVRDGYITCFRCGFGSKSVSGQSGHPVNWVRAILNCSVKEAVEAIISAYHGKSRPVCRKKPSEFSGVDRKSLGFPSYELCLNRVQEMLGEDWCLVGVWKYSEEFYQHRFQRGEQKTYRPVWYDNEDKVWRIGCPSRPWPLYRLKEALESGEDFIYVTEGEKACDAAWDIGLPAVSPFGGAQSPERSNWLQMAGRKVCILPDCDEPGWGFARKIRKVLYELDPRPIVRVVGLPGDPADDIVEFILRVGEDRAKQYIQCKVIGVL